MVNILKFFVYNYHFNSLIIIILIIYILISSVIISFDTELEFVWA